MSCRFVITEKTENFDTKIKARWCLRGSHDPDLVQKVLSGKCHSPTLAQFSRNMLLQLIVSHRWTMKLGDIKGAFRSQCQRSTVSQSCVCWLPPGGVPGIEPGSLVQVTGNIYGANYAPHTWYMWNLTKTATERGFTRSKFDSCLYFCYGVDGKLEGVLGAHVNDTITGGHGQHYERAVAQLRSRFPLRKWCEGQGECLRMAYTQCPNTKEITYSQQQYTDHIQLIGISKFLNTMETSHFPRNCLAPSRERCLGLVVITD